ncbi:MAG: ATP-binding protein, partial [Vicinamibacterales bacterium]
MTSPSTDRLLRALRREQQLRLETERIVERQRHELASTREDLRAARRRADDIQGALDLSRQQVEQIEERTAQLAERRDAAEAMAHVKMALLATMTHELRTPLSGVHGMVSLLLDSDLTEAQRDHACHILSSTEALLSIVDDVLDYSRVEAGRLQIEDVEFDPVGVVDDVLTLLGSRSADKRIELAAMVAPDVPASVNGDPGRVRQILVNLVGNALKFTETGHVIVRLGLVPAPSGSGHCLRFEIEDTGLGIAPSALPHLFQPFTQADASMSRLFGGSGLGLSICRRLAEALGGEIGASSEPGKGSTFWFTVAVHRHAGAFLRSTDQLAGAHILIMTRSDIAHTVLTQALESAGAAVHRARTSGEVVRLARAAGTSFDAAIVDLQQREARATVGGAEFHGL